MLDFGLYFLYLLLFVGVLGAIVFPILNAVKQPKTLMRSLMGLGALLLLFGIGFALSSSDVTARQAAEGLTGTASKLVGAGLIMFYTTLILAAVSVVYSEITNALK